MIKKFENFQIDLNISYELYRLDNVGDEEGFILSNDDLNSNVYDLNDMYKLLKKYQKADKTVFLKKITTENLYPNDLDIIMKSNKYNL
ncbi:hypothetical protein M0Q97_10555 [Candidatus Dojkabacteria bacterium]|jgi:hypothetical protein|nr:hypothetical protein [Candidatus Dojkabacteria bacterium]